MLNRLISTTMWISLKANACELRATTRQLQTIITKGTTLVVIVLLVLLIVGISSLSAQVVVDLSIKRSLYLAYEPILVTVHLKNLSGSTLLFDNNKGHPWLSFSIETAKGTPLPPSNLDNETPPLSISEGESLSKAINLTTLYPLGDFGSYRIRATVYVSELHRYFSSLPLTIEITEGRLLWQQTIGISCNTNSINNRTISLLSHRLPDHTALYLRVEDKEQSIIFCTHLLGCMMTYHPPEVLLDAAHHIHILYQESPHHFLYVEGNADGTLLRRKTLTTSKTLPSLKITDQGTIVLTTEETSEKKPLKKTISTLSDRPVPLPHIVR